MHLKITLNHDLIFPPPGAVESVPFNGNEALDTANVRKLITRLYLPYLSFWELCFMFAFVITIFLPPKEIELVFKPHPKDNDPETICEETRYIKTSAIATGNNYDKHLKTYLGIHCSWNNWIDFPGIPKQKQLHVHIYNIQ